MAQDQQSREVNKPRLASMAVSQHDVQRRLLGSFPSSEGTHRERSGLPSGDIGRSTTGNADGSIEPRPGDLRLPRECVLELPPNEPFNVPRQNARHESVQLDPQSDISDPLNAGEDRGSKDSSVSVSPLS